jgi:hypothetical protein
MLRLSLLVPEHVLLLLLLLLLLLALTALNHSKKGCLKDNPLHWAQCCC